MRLPSGRHMMVAVVVAVFAACGGERATEPDTAAIQAASITVTPHSVTLGVSDTQRVSATLRDSSGALILGQTVSWSSGDTGIARVSAAGVVRGAAPGATRLTVMGGGRSATVDVTVTDTVAGTPPDSSPPPPPPPPPPPAVRPGYYVSPAGSGAGDGTHAHPWDLATALAGGAGRVQPGDTIWLLGGVYRGEFRSTLQGTAGRPIVVRQYPGARAVLDGPGGSGTILRVSGPYTVFWGFEITKSDPARTTSSTGNHFRGNSVANYASHTKYINLIVRDGGVAFYTEAMYADVEIAGCIIYNNGWQGPDRGHGHALYLKSLNGPVVARDNVMFNQFGYGIHSYTNAGSGQLSNLRYEGNVAFNNGTLSNNSSSANILLGGDDYATGDVLVDNLTYFSPSVSGKNVQIGYGTLRNGSVRVEGNYFAGGAPVLEVGYWTSATVRTNTFIGTSAVVLLNDPSTSGHTWSGEMFHRDPLSSSWQYRGSAYSFAGWRSATGLTSAGQATPGLPTTTRVFVRPNPYERGRANVAVYNWARQALVVVDLTQVLTPGDTFDIRNVQDLRGAPVVSGVYAGGSVTLPMRGVTPPVPVGMSSSRAPATGIDFNTYIVTLRGAQP